MGCSTQKSCVETIDGLKKRFQKLAVVTLINAKGDLDGIFQLIFDRQGLFILGNLMIMPEQMASLLEKCVSRIQSIFFDLDSFEKPTMDLPITYLNIELKR